MPLPADRGHLSTERRHEASADLDLLGTEDAVRLMIEDHDAVGRALRGAAAALAALVDDVAARMDGGGRLVYVGAGTSGRLGVLDAAECPPTFQVEPDRVVGIIAGGDAALRRSSEGLEDDPRGAAPARDALRLGPRDALVGIAAGGTTPYVRGAVELAAARGALAALVTCAPEATAPAGCAHLVCLDTGAELLAGSTRLKAGTATKLALNVLSTAVFVRLGRVHGNLMVDLRATNDKLRDRAIRILRELHPELDRPGAASLLADAGGHLKTAIVMRGLGVGRAEAEARLERHGGRLRAVLG